MERFLINLFLFVSLPCIGQIIPVGDDDLSALWKCEPDLIPYEDDYELPDFKAGALYFRILGEYGDSIVEVYPPKCNCNEDDHYSQLDTCIIPAKVIYNDKIYVVKGIGAFAFDGCSRLKKVVLPNTITYIGPGAFSMCDSIISINIPESVKRVCYPDYDIWLSPYIYDVFQALPDSIKYKPHMVMIP